jgi:ribosome-binding protein aMBF1 (putative translation factor)
MARRSWNEVRAEKAKTIPNFDQEVTEAQLRMDLAQFVYDLRTAAGLTQSELAQRMGTTQSAIARLEGGGANPSTELLQRLGVALDVRMVLAVEGGGDSSHPVVISNAGPTARAS